eukprot:CAMPEP_0170598088 /NCGR_PEP_ID=MMETSP0224-20130122/16055_1 /TAXON_ID=285029 /ORGANISM="Togula jolla, Strain CCCM 725" /LENGTH=232 /DNA_ID=CAMNT_0010922605 /DNA_START=265 /DNA_END=962 /DNA_ORIENTATION=+
MSTELVGIADAWSCGIVFDAFCNTRPSQSVVRLDFLRVEAHPLESVGELPLKTVLEPEDVIVSSPICTVDKAIQGDRAPMGVHHPGVLLADEAHEVCKTDVLLPIDHKLTALDLVQVGAAQAVPGIPHKGEGEGLAEVLPITSLHNLQGILHPPRIPATLPSLLIAWEATLDAFPLSWEIHKSSQGTVDSCAADFGSRTPEPMLPQQDHVVWEAPYVMTIFITLHDAMARHE